MNPVDSANLTKLQRTLLVLAALLCTVLFLLKAAGAEEDLLSQAQEAYRHSKFTQAAEILGEYLEQHPESLEAYRLRAKAFSRGGHPDQALALLEQGLAGFPRDADLLLERGKLLKKLDRYPEALYSFSQIIELDPRHSEALKERAALKAVLGNHDEAIKDLNLAILLNPDDPYSYLNRGLVRTRQGDYLAAVQDFTAAIKLQSDLPEPYYHRANLYYFCLDQKDKAFSDYRQACRLGHSLACQQIREVDDKAAASGEAEDTAAAPAAAGEDEAVKRVQMEALKQLQDKMHEADGVAVAAAPLLQPKPKAKKPSPNLKDILLIILADVPFPVILLTLLFFFCLIEAGLLILSNDERRQKQRLQKRLQYLRGLEKRSQASLIKTDGLSQIPWLSQFLKKIRRLGQLQNLLVQADVNWSVGTFLLVTCGISAVLMSLGFFKLGNLGALGGVALGLVLPFQFLKFKRKMRLRKFEKQLPEALDLLSRSLRAGHAFAAGLQLVAEEMANPLGMEFFKVFKEYNHGLDINTSLLNLCQRLELQELRFFTTAVIIQRETGGNLTDILEKISTLIRERFKLLNHIKALTAEGRMSGLVLILLPPGLAMMMLKINPKYIMLLVNTEIGRIMAMLAFGLQVLGIFAIHKIVNIKV